MLKQSEIFNKLVLELKKDIAVEGVLLNGSVAVGTATELSDLDMIVLCNEIKFVSEVIDDVLVEIHYITYDKAIKRLNNYPMEVYKYLDAKIAYDNGKLKEIITCTENIFYHYCVSEKEKRKQHLKPGTAFLERATRPPAVPVSTPPKRP